MSRAAALLAPAVPSVPQDARAALEAHHDAAWSWALSCARGDRQAAHDVLHDAYLKVLAGRALFAGRSSYKTWLFGVIRMSAMAARRRRALADLLFEPIGAAAEAVGAAPKTPASRRLQTAVAELPARQREIVALVFAHDLTIEEAAAVMNVSVGSARQHHARAKEKLRAALIPQVSSHD